MIGKFLLKQLNDLRRSDTLCDLELISEDGNSFKIHHILFLALNPRYYEKHCMGRQYRNPAINKNMLLSCVNYEELKAVVDFIYGKPVVLRSRFEVLKKALEKLSMDHLIKEAGGFTFMPEEAEVKTEIENTEVKTEPDDPSYSYKIVTQPSEVTQTTDINFTSTETESLPSAVNLASCNVFTSVQEQLSLIESTLPCYNSLTNTQTQPARKSSEFVSHMNKKRPKDKDSKSANTTPAEKRASSERNQTTCSSKEIKRILKSQIVSRQKNGNILKVDEGYPTTYLRPFGTDHFNMDMNNDPKDTLNDQVITDTNIYNKEAANDQANKDLNNDPEDTPNHQVNTDTNNYNKEATNDQVSVDGNNDSKNTQNDQVKMDINNVPEDKQNYQVNTDTNNYNKEATNDEVSMDANNDCKNTLNDQVNIDLNNDSQDTQNYQVNKEINPYHKDRTNDQISMDANNDSKNTPNDQVNMDLNNDSQDTQNYQVNKEINPYHKDTTNDQISMDANNDSKNTPNDQVNMDLNNDSQDTHTYQVITDTNNFHKDITNDQVDIDANNYLKDTLNDQINMETNNGKDKPKNTSYGTYGNNVEISGFEQNDCTSDKMKDTIELKEKSEISDLKKNKMKQSELSAMEKVSDKLKDTGNEKHDKKNKGKIGFLSNQRNLIAMSSKCEATHNTKSSKRNFIRKNVFEIDFSKVSANTGEIIDSENLVEAESDNHYNETEVDQTNCKTGDGVERESLHIQNYVKSKASSDKEIIGPSNIEKVKDMPMLGEINVSLCCPLNKDDVLQDASQSADKVECQADLVGAVQDVSQKPGDNQTCLESGENIGNCSADTVQKSYENFNTENTCVGNIDQENITNELDSSGKDKSIVNTKEQDKSKVKDQITDNINSGVETENNKLYLLYKNCVPEPINMVKLSLSSRLEIFSPTDTSDCQMNLDQARKLDEHSYSRSDPQQTTIGKFQEIVTCLSRISNKSQDSSSEMGHLQQPITEDSHKDKERSSGKGQDCSGGMSHLQKSNTKDSHQNTERCDEIVQSTTSIKCNVPNKEKLKLRPSDVKDRTKKMKGPGTNRKKVKASCSTRGMMMNGTEESSAVALTSSDLPKLDQPSQVKRKGSFIRRKVQPSGHELKRLLDKRTISVKLCRLPTTEILSNVPSNLTDIQSNKCGSLVKNREPIKDGHLDICIGPGSIWRDNPLEELSSEVQKDTEEVLHANDSSNQVSASSSNLETVNGMDRQTDEELLQLCYEKQRHEMMNNDISHRKLAPKSSSTVETGPKIPVFCYKVSDLKVALCPITHCQNFASIAPKPSHSDEQTNKTEASTSSTKGETEQLISDKEWNACRNAKIQKKRKEITRITSCLKDGCDSNNGISKPEIKTAVNEDTPLSAVAKSLNKTSKTRIMKSKSKIKEENTPLSVLAKNLKLKRKANKSKSRLNKNKQFETPNAISKQACDNDLKINDNSSSVPREQIQEKKGCLKTWTSNSGDSNNIRNISESCENVMNKRKLNDHSVINNIDDSDNKKLKVCESKFDDDKINFTNIPKFHESLSDSKPGTLSKGSTGSYRFHRRSMDLHRKWNSVKKKSPVSTETVCHQDNVLFEFDSREVLRKKLNFK